MGRVSVENYFMIIKLLYIISVSLASYVFAQDVDENTFLPDMGVVIQSADKSSKLEPPLEKNHIVKLNNICLLYTSPSPRDLSTSRMPSSA